MATASNAAALELRQTVWAMQVLSLGTDQRVMSAIAWFRQSRFDGTVASTLATRDSGNLPIGILRTTPDCDAACAKGESAQSYWRHFRRRRGDDFPHRLSARAALAASVASSDGLVWFRFISVAG